MDNAIPVAGDDATVHASINGVAVTARPQETILHCARRHGFHIPSLCELDDIDHTPGTCRVCMVEIRSEGQEHAQLVASCTTPMQPGLDVFTRTPRVRETQRLQV